MSWQDNFRKGFREQELMLKAEMVFDRNGKMLKNRSDIDYVLHQRFDKFIIVKALPNPISEAE